MVLLLENVMWWLLFIIMRLMYSDRMYVCKRMRRSYGEPTQEAAVQVSNNTCLKILCFFGARAHQAGCDFHLVEASELSFVFYCLVSRQWLCWIREIFLLTVSARITRPFLIRKLSS
ncbi:hypothetical protein PoB_004161300 [Plakobranchus ocellatus]|uniref:Secreted protein n=1 Tax=Plakobranchus ocellatus TaxID=259542 RepID=A0AAV4B7H0_9GAST|nr:hypothetical protein PoB_004161300 [Plakobranchus ocellatus]